MEVWKVLILFVLIVVTVGVFVGLVLFEFFQDIKNDIEQILSQVEAKLDPVLSYHAPNDTIIDYGNDVPTNIPQTDEYNLQTAQFSCRLVNSVLNELMGKDPQYPPQFTKIMVIGDTQAVLLRRPLQNASNRNGPFFYVLCYRGTITIADKDADLNDVQTNYVSLNGNTIQGAMVLKGGYEEWFLLKDQLLEVQSMIKTGDTLLICGHSLGGLFTSLTALSFSDNINPDNMSFYCIESINIGNNTFVTAVENSVPNHWYIRNISDIIPNYPLAVTISFGSTSYYSYPRNVVQTNINVGNIGGNHTITTNLCGLNPSQPVLECPPANTIAWANEPQITGPAPYTL